jgi:hypothetical protein
MQAAVFLETLAMSYQAARRHFTRYVNFHEPCQEKSNSCSVWILQMFTNIRWVGLRSWCRDWLQAGRSADRIPVEARFSAPVQTGPGTQPSSCTMGTRSFPGVKSGRGETLTPHLPSSAVLMKE